MSFSPEQPRHSSIAPHNGHMPSCGQKIGRRELLAGAAGSLALAGCSLHNPNAPKPLVSITRATAYTQDLYDTVRRIFAEHRLEVRGKRVLVKPNLVEFDAGVPINTHPLVVNAVYDALLALGAKVRIAEGPGHRRNTLELAEAAGFFDIVPRFEDAFTDLNLDDVAKMRLRHPESRLASLFMPRTALQADLIVSVPKMKTHHWVGATLGMKNFFGLVPGGVYGWPKNVLHWAGITECIVDLHRMFPNTFTLVDGITGMQGNGPIQGQAKEAGVIVAGADAVAVDATCCRIMGIDPERVVYLTLAANARQTEDARVQVIGERIAAVRSDFDLPPSFGWLRLRR
ncbi:MAG: DUF362 domain-containing protein [Bryobacteraceae bacterium]